MRSFQIIKMKEFNLSDKITLELNSGRWKKEEDVKEFIKWCDEHSFVTDEGLRVIDINKLKEEAGEELIE